MSKRKRGVARWKKWHSKAVDISNKEKKMYNLIDDVTGKYVVVNSFRQSFSHFSLTSNKKEASSHPMIVFSLFLINFGHKGKFRPVRAD